MQLFNVSIFWKKRSLINYLLSPFSYIYYLGFKLSKLFQQPQKIEAKVICIGNIVVGGAGKTPIAMAVGEYIKKFGYKIAFISRGYNGSLSNSTQVVKVNLAKHTYKDVGDEPILLANIAPTYICKNRYLSAKKAQEDGAQVVILDDGFQNRSLVKDFSILVIDKGFKLGNEMLLPAGPLREPLFLALPRTDLICIASANLNKEPLRIKSECPTFNVNTKIINTKHHEGKKYIALVGIGLPEKFFNTLKLLRIKVIEEFIFPDHYPYTIEDLAKPIAIAEKVKCKIITTEKDLIRIPKALQKYFDTVKIQAVLPEVMKKMIRESL